MSSEDLTGQTFGRLTVLKRLAFYYRKEAGYLCKCSCGNTKIIRRSNLKKGNTKSCGCLQRENLAICHEIQHGLSGSRIYTIWQHMLDRCYNSSHSQYHNYGGRGITVCDEWLNVICFKDWAVNNGYDDKLSIERKDVNGNYEPNNCTWIPLGEQGLNRRNNHYITINGITKPASIWAKEYGISSSAMYSRIKHGRMGEELLKPMDKRFSKLSKCKTENDAQRS